MRGANHDSAIWVYIATYISRVDDGGVVVVVVVVIYVLEYRTSSPTKLIFAALRSLPRPSMDPTTRIPS